jgi:hypothetical protein
MLSGRRIFSIPLFVNLTTYIMAYRRRKSRRRSRKSRVYRRNTIRLKRGGIML